MGRTGGGSASHGRSSGGGHSFSRSSGGHRVGGSSGTRTGSSSSRSSYSRSSGLQRSTHTVRHYHYGRSYGPSYRSTTVYRSGGAVFATWLNIITIILVMLFVFFAVKAATGTVKNDVPRTKLETGNAFDNNCIEDQIGWFDNISNTSRQLQQFWKETGVQPYILLRADDGTLTTDMQKQEWAEDYYDANIDREDAFLYVYFYEDGEEAMGVPGYMAYTSGYEASSVMDAGAVEIFWNYLDRYWVTDMSMDEVMYTTFNKTGETIMHVSTTGKDVVKWILIAIVTGIVGFVVAFAIKKSYDNKRAKAAEDERILNTKVDGLSGSGDIDPLEDKYLK